MRPATLEEFVGQEHLVGEGRILRRILNMGGKFPSLILWGPPGTGKTTLARLLADKSGAHFVQLSAVFSGVKELRAAISDAKEARRHGERTILSWTKSIVSTRASRTLFCRQLKTECHTDWSYHRKTPHLK